MRWFCILAYLGIAVAAPFCQTIQDNQDLAWQAMIAICLAGWSIDLRKMSGPTSGSKIMLYAMVGHSLFIALTDGRFEFSRLWIRGEAGFMGGLCLGALLFDLLRGFLWTKCRCRRRS